MQGTEPLLDCKHICKVPGRVHVRGVSSPFSCVVSLRHVETVFHLIHNLTTCLSSLLLYVFNIHSCFLFISHLCILRFVYLFIFFSVFSSRDTIYPFSLLLRPVCDSLPTYSPLIYFLLASLLLPIFIYIFI